MCNRSLKQTAISLSSREAQFSNCSRNFTTKFQFVSKWIQTRQDTFRSAEDQAGLTHWVTMPVNTAVEKRQSSRRTTQSIFSRNILTDCVNEHSRRNWDHAFWMWLMVVRTGTTDYDNWQLLTSVCSLAGCKFYQFLTCDRLYIAWTLTSVP